MTFEQIMELIADYQTAVENLADYEARWAYIEPDMFQHKFDSYAALRTAIEELHRDAARHKFVVKSPIHAVCEWNPPRQMGCTGWYELDEEQLDAAMEAK